MTDEANIPVLTDVITVDSPAVPLSPPSEAAQPLQGAEPAAALTEEQWRLLEAQIRENVLKQVLGRIDFVLEHRVRDNLADVLQTAVESLADDIRSGLKSSLAELVGRALSQEINKIRSGQP